MELPGSFDPEGGRIDGWPDFVDRVRAAVALASVASVSIYLADPDFVRWPLGERAVIAALEGWALNSRATQCVVLSATFDQLPGRHPRWVSWRAVWSHRVRCALAAAEQADQVKPLLILQDPKGLPQLGLQLLDPVTGRGLWSRRAGELSEWRQRLDVILQRCSDALPPTTLGL